MLPTLRQMQYFVALAEHRSFGRAARACHVTQSTLSGAIRQFEACLGAELVDRSGKVLSLTEAGESVLVRAGAILRETEDMAAHARIAAAPLSGRLRLGVIPSIAPFLLPQALPALRAAQPQLRLVLREELTRVLLQDLRDGRLDVALIALPHDTGDFACEVIGVDPLFVAVPQGHPLGQDARVSLARLQREPLLLLEDGHCLREHVLMAFAGKAPRESEDIRASSMTTLVQMVDNGLGVTLVPRIAVEAGIARGTRLSIVPIEEAGAQRELAIVWRRRSAHGADARALAAALRGFVTSGEEPASVCAVGKEPIETG
ncbi:MAG: LysR family transcriptional regulator [Stappia sp.]|uniref:hydrogen peroxide-inducible genes activator n=1 Tax=Stappia sp. TaxID=1870903 RepID=UPI000C661353|nr:hydrogen peroxide-inducible genes activator [Stappia sp.]MAA99502.1 LysR family transcriptional regulator [Stappia sp.]MBM20428.1 LysR family transcriptional regulator [Stappia sp.]